MAGTTPRSLLTRPSDEFRATHCIDKLQWPSAWPLEDFWDEEAHPGTWEPTQAARHGPGAPQRLLPHHPLQLDDSVFERMNLGFAPLREEAEEAGQGA